MSTKTVCIRAFVIVCFCVCALACLCAWLFAGFLAGLLERLTVWCGLVLLRCVRMAGLLCGLCFQVDNRRKVMVLSASFLNLGQAALTQNDVWITLAVARTHGCIDRVRGGWSTMLRILLEDLFYGPLGISVVGFPVSLPAGRVLLYASLASLLADGDGLRISFDWRGAGSLKPCLVHHNVLRKAGITTADLCESVFVLLLVAAGPLWRLGRCVC